MDQNLPRVAFFTPIVDQMDPRVDQIDPIVDQIDPIVARIATGAEANALCPARTRVIISATEIRMAETGAASRRTPLRRSPDGPGVLLDNSTKWHLKVP